eukprot:GHVL01002248.1.p1 GENE.GHVL01002248.1~~GHVL01002248.1.p1  ORF type:complete len:316 (-),score=68.87 GHVL01002248.1:210-1127(-)
MNKIKDYSRLTRQSTIYRHFCSNSQNLKIFSQNSENIQNLKKDDNLKKNPFSIEEILYLSREAGLYTLKEKQLLIMRSPPFSPNKHPFVLENFFESMEAPLPIDMPPDVYGNVDENDAKSYKISSKIDIILSNAATASNSNCNTELVPTKTFMLNNREWKIEAEGTGTRRRATAHVVIKRGSGRVVIIKKRGELEDLYYRWAYYYNRMDVIQPLFLTKTTGVFDVYISLRGGGPGGQAGAARLAVGRALVDACPTCSQDLKEDNVLYEDKRQKWSHQWARKGRREHYKFVKRPIGKKIDIYHRVK